ncbi:MAG: hypothetical protein ACD_60C00143G0038 [uncultured bacterium]|nr:MAG: hypothetical protein ACD_60C00143G0038 [uncultured bacterium]
MNNVSINVSNQQAVIFELNNEDVLETALATLQHSVIPV